MSQENLDSEEKIAGLVYETQKTMADKGVNESLSSLIAHLDQGFPANAPKQHWTKSSGSALHGKQRSKCQACTGRRTHR